MIETISLRTALDSEADYIRTIAYAMLNDVNVDDIKTPGQYYLTTGITGASLYSYLIVFKVSYNLTQINYTNGINMLRIRNYHNGEWTNWASIALQS